MARNWKRAHDNLANELAQLKSERTAWKGEYELSELRHHKTTAELVATRRKLNRAIDILMGAAENMRVRTDLVSSARVIGDAAYDLMTKPDTEQR